ncbi:hypothetical protein M1D80_11020 [Phyllobacteriaceae bacterium JZ32]
MNNVETVSITLDGAQLTLTPSPAAAVKISNGFGGLLNAVDRVQRYDVEAMAFVISAGAELVDAKREALPGQLFRHGLVELIVPTVKFLSLLATGGRKANLSSGEIG